MRNAYPVLCNQTYKNGEDKVSEAKYVDGLLVDWGEKVFNYGIRKVSQTKKGITGLLIPQKQKYNTKQNANDIRGKLNSIAKRSPEVMVKISGGGKGGKQIKNHFEYITRNGQLEIEDQDGHTMSGFQSLNGLHDEWCYGGFPISEESDRKEAFNIVLSMPEGTNSMAVKRAVRDFAASEFANHQYVMVLHTYETDPDPEPSKNPHVHLCVKARSHDGTRLNPRKNDLFRWREHFAQSLREHGVEAVATKREQRTLRSKSSKETRFKDTQKQFDKNGRKATRIKRSTQDDNRIEKAKFTENKVMSGYQEITKALANSEDLSDRKLAVSLVTFLKQQRGKDISADVNKLNLEKEINHEKTRTSSR